VENVGREFLGRQERRSHDRVTFGVLRGAEGGGRSHGLLADIALFGRDLNVAEWLRLTLRVWIDIGRLGGGGVGGIGGGDGVHGMGWNLSFLLLGHKWVRVDAGLCRVDVLVQRRVLSRRLVVRHSMEHQGGWPREHGVVRQLLGRGLVRRDRFLDR